jgi:SAM-dependent methyltransferase
MDIETDTDPDKLASMIRHIEENWTILGSEDPHWSVLTGERFRKEVIGENIEAFYESGLRTLQFFLAAAERANLDISRLRTCFELGCGVGRITVWLAEHFRQVVAADISIPHINLASDAVRERSISNVQFRVLNRIELLRELPPFDAFFSVIVLQHNPPPVIALLLTEILRKLNPGGIAYFQVPTYKFDGQFNAADYLSKIDSAGKMEVHAIPQAKVWEIADACNCRVMDVREDGWVGSTNFISNSILLRKGSN